MRQEKKQLQVLGRAIRARREAMNVSQDDFAVIIGMHRAYYSAIERGERNITFRLLVRVAKGLKISLEQLMADARL